VCPAGAPLAGEKLGTAVFAGNATVFVWLVFFMANPNAWLAPSRASAWGLSPAESPKKERPARTNSHRPYAMTDIN
jgi:hypothetical protein